MNQIDMWHKLYDRIVEMQVRAGDMARDACRNGEFYWLGRYDALREVAMELEPIALSEDKEPGNNRQQPQPKMPESCVRCSMSDYKCDTSKVKRNSDTCHANLWRHFGLA